jgi:hypothetical protein
MQLRARHVLVPFAAVAAGGAIRGLLRRRARRRAAAMAAGDAIVEEIDGIPTAPIDVTEVEVVLLDADLPDDEAEVAVLGDPSAPGFDILVMYDAQPETEPVAEGVTNATRAPMVNPDPIDDRDDGENWFEASVQRATEATPAERPLRLRSDPGPSRK